MVSPLDFERWNCDTSEMSCPSGVDCADSWEVLNEGSTQDRVRRLRDKEIAEMRIDFPHVWREESDDSVDTYRVVLSEVDLLYIEDALINKVKEMMFDLHRSAEKIGFTTDHECWAEDAAFLANSIYRITSFISQAQWLRNHPSDTESIL
jgi:hypothetical protein